MCRQRRKRGRRVRERERKRWREKGFRDHDDSNNNNNVLFGRVDCTMHCALSIPTRSPGQISVPEGICARVACIGCVLVLLFPKDQVWGYEPNSVQYYDREIHCSVGGGGALCRCRTKWCWLPWRFVLAHPLLALVCFLGDWMTKRDNVCVYVCVFLARSFLIATSNIPFFSFSSLHSFTHSLYWSPPLRFYLLYPLLLIPLLLLTPILPYLDNSSSFINSTVIVYR